MRSSLIQIVDAAMAEAVRRSGDWIACRAGCFDCCLGPFEISEQDGQHLREGLAVLRQTDPDRAVRVYDRAAGMSGEQGEDEPCPALDPEAGTCDLYAWRPITCRTFGPAVRMERGPVGACELCYDGATDEEIAACAVNLELEEAAECTTVARSLTG